MLQCNAKVTIGNTEIERREKREDIEYKDLKEIDEDIVNVNLTQKQYDKLISKYNKEIVVKKILKFNEWIVCQKNKNKRDHYLTINNWCREESNNKPKSNKTLERKICDMF